MDKLPPNITVRHEFRPGDIGFLTYLHGTLYAKDSGWDHTFEAYVAGPLSEFAKSHSAREKIWLLDRDATLAGSIAIVEASRDAAQLRWLLLHPDLRGKGLGRFLMDQALQFCRAQKYRSVFLWTEASLLAAAGLYASAGFRLTEEKTHEFWGSTVTEQRYELTF
ncbi:MAG TPA: GNAT family N-acetyltransferase [Bacteroidota bacterium]|nr:GNAT family N-acetyltransferase [Bacteroidota bacterium]